MSFTSVCRQRVPLGALVVLGGAVALWSQPAARSVAAPVVGKSMRYCNPLPVPASSTDGAPQGVSLGDVTVVREGEFYYLFATGGGAWVSRDFVNWRFQAVDVRGGRLPVAPHVVKYNGAFYMSGNDAPLYKAPGILGPYEVLGPWKDERGEPWKVTFNGTTANGAFDVDLFVDDDNKPYLYFPGRSTAGIYVAPLDPKDLTHLTAAPKHLFGFDPSHVWERWGEKNEYTGIAWIEGPWAFKRNGTYYIRIQRLGYPVAVVRERGLLGEEPAGAFHVLSAKSTAQEDHRNRHWPGPRLRGEGSGRELVGVLYHCHGESRRGPPDRHGPHRIRLRRQSVHERSE
jgi:hypothetical protein